MTHKRWEASASDDNDWRALVPILAKITREVVHRGPFTLLLPRLDAAPGAAEDDLETYFLRTLLQRIVADTERSTSLGSQTRESAEL